MTAAITNRLLEAVAGQVNLCESQGDGWLIVERDITTDRAAAAGFNLNSPAVRSVFTEAAHFHGARGPWED